MVETVVSKENETENHLDTLLRDQFEQLSDKLNFEMSSLSLRVSKLEKVWVESRWQAKLDQKVSYDDLEKYLADHKAQNLKFIMSTLEKHRKDIDNLEVSEHFILTLIDFHG